MAATGEVRAEAEVAWRAEKKVARRATEAGCRKATRGVTGKREVALDCNDGEQRRGAARADSQTAWHGGERPARGREGGGEAGEDAWKGAEQRGGGGGAAHGRQEQHGASGRGAEEGEREVHERGPGCNFQKGQGPQCNALITFKLELKWKWTQNQKCRIYQNLQLCFKVHLQKS
jgi:hypothetical protein